MGSSDSKKPACFKKLNKNKVLILHYIKVSNAHFHNKKKCLHEKAPAHGIQRGKKSRYLFLQEINRISVREPLNHFQLLQTLSTCFVINTQEQGW